MKDKTQRDIDLEEIFSHVQRIKEEQITTGENRQIDLEPLEIIKEQTEVIAGDLNMDNIKPEDIFEVLFVFLFWNRLCCLSQDGFYKFFF